MEERWYYLTDRNEVVGPVSGNALRSLFTSGEITSASSVCREGTEEWVSATASLGRPAETPKPTATVDELIADMSKPDKKQPPGGCYYGCLVSLLLGVAFIGFAIYISATTEPSTFTPDDRPKWRIENSKQVERDYEEAKKEMEYRSRHRR